MPPLRGSAREAFVLATATSRRSFLTGRPWPAARRNAVRDMNGILIAHDRPDGPRGGAPHDMALRTESPARVDLAVALLLRSRHPGRGEPPRLWHDVAARRPRRPGA